jgi:predicted NUDIX family NTP pyrophosphohydrolase
MTGESAGILLYRSVDDGIEVLLVHPGGPFWRNKDLGAWSLPKGEIEPGEDPRAVGVRELAEETGIVLTAREQASLVDLGSVRQRGGKVVHAWAVERDVDADAITSNTFRLEWPPRSGTLRDFPEVDRAAWFDPATACEKLNVAQRDVVGRLLALLEGASGGG